MNASSFSMPRNAQRALVHAGDEAWVHRLSCANPFFNNLAERTERLDCKTGMEIAGHSLLFSAGQLKEMVRSDCVEGQAMRYHLLRLGNVFFPQNFPRAYALRFFDENFVKYGVIYSEFVPDQTGCIARKERYFENYDRLPYGIHELTGEIVMSQLEWKQWVRWQFDQEERARCPQMGEIKAKAKEAGIGIIHPEINYHVSGSNVVFFEPNHLDFEKARAHAEGLEGSGRDRALAYIGLICYDALSECLRLHASRSMKEEWRELERLVKGRDSGFLHAFLKFVKKHEDFTSIAGNTMASYIQNMSENIRAILAGAHSF